MKTEKRKRIIIACGLLSSFVLWTVAVCTVDLGQIGPDGAGVGFSTLNAFVRDLIGVNMTLYLITDWLGLVPILVALAFAILGGAQWLRRKSLFAVDKSILALGLFYLSVIGVYVLFEMLALNYRPVLIDGFLEASYPSSTTLLTVSVMLTALMQIKRRLKCRTLAGYATALVVLFTAFMVVARILSGVHWITDIIGGLFVSLGLVALYSIVEI